MQQYQEVTAEGLWTVTERGGVWLGSRLIRDSDGRDLQPTTPRESMLAKRVHAKWQRLNNRAIRKNEV
jgi:hypothetical protein